MKRSIMSISIALLVVFLSVSPSLAAKLTVGEYVFEFDEKVKADTDANGTDDRTTYYQKGQMVLSVYDENENGRPDVWIRYANGDTADLELADKNGDGNPDMIVEINAQGKADVLLDTDVSWSKSFFRELRTLFFGMILVWIGYIALKKYSVKQTPISSEM